MGHGPTTAVGIQTAQNLCWSNPVYAELTAKMWGGKNPTKIIKQHSMVHALPNNVSHSCLHNWWIKAPVLLKITSASNTPDRVITAVLHKRQLHSKNLWSIRLDIFGQGY